MDLWDTSAKNSYLHYVNLLCLRKRARQLIEFEFEREYGRVAGDADRDQIAGAMHRRFGERGFLIAKKGSAQNQPGPVLPTDEEVVYVAFSTAVATGRQVAILTKDEDLLEQFYKLVYLVDTHYRSMLIADAYADDPGSSSVRGMPRDGQAAEVFCGDSNVLVERSASLPNDVLPSTFSFVAVNCWLIGAHFLAFAFGAEREMARVLDVKGSDPGGRNTTRLGSRNCHLTLPGITVPDQNHSYFAVASDRCLSLPSSGREIPALEFLQAIETIERFEHLE